MTTYATTPHLANPRRTRATAPAAPSAPAVEPGPGQLTVGVVGLGYLGAVHAACMADLGHRVIGYDIDAGKVEALREARAPFFEPGLEDLLARTHGEGLSFTTEVADLAAADVVFVCVGTPQRPGELAADTRYVTAAVDALAEVLPGRALLVGKSTVPVGTAAALAEALSATAPQLEVAWNPEFLREGHAVADTLTPDRLVFGVTSAYAEAVLRRVYARALDAGTPLIVTDRPTAELVKVAANAFLATKISFINAMAEVSEAAGADITTLADAIGHDDRIGRKFLNAGLGFGGGCLPKDIRAFTARATELGAGQAVGFLTEVDAINLRRRTKVVELARAAVGGDLAGARVAVLGAAFKPLSDDVRDSPALDVAARLRAEGAHVTVTDPAAVDNARRQHPELDYAPTAQQASAGADVVLLLTEWEEYRSIDPAALAAVVRHPRVIDARNALDAQRWAAAGWDHRGLGRPSPAATATGAASPVHAAAA